MKAISSQFNFVLIYNGCIIHFHQKKICFLLSIILFAHCHAICYVVIPKFGHIFIFELHLQHFITSGKHKMAS
jgi:hypothetical protein